MTANTFELIALIIGAFIVGTTVGAYLAYTVQDFQRSEDPCEWYGEQPLSLTPGASKEGKPDDLPREIKEYLGI